MMLRMIMLRRRRKRMIINVPEEEVEEDVAEDEVEDDDVEDDDVKGEDEDDADNDDVEEEEDDDTEEEGEEEEEEEKEEEEDQSQDPQCVHTVWETHVAPGIIRGVSIAIETPNLILGQSGQSFAHLLICAGWFEFVLASFSVTLYNSIMMIQRHH